MVKNIKGLQSIKHYIPFNLIVVLPYIFIIVFCMLVLVRSGIIRGLDIFFDFYIFYTAGELWNEGQNVYDLDIFTDRLDKIRGRENDQDNKGWALYFYPPQGSFLFSLLAKLPLDTAHQAFLGVNVLLLIVSLGMLAFILSWYRPIGLPEVALLASFLITDFGRMSLRNSQWSIFVFVFILATFILTRVRQNTLAGLSLAAVSLKPSFLPFYIVYYLLKRSYRLVAVCLLAAGLLTFLPLVFTHRPIIETMIDWLHVISIQNDPGQIHYISPTAPFAVLVSLVHLSAFISRALTVESNITSAISSLIILVSIIYTIYLIYRKSSPETALLDFGLISALSLLSVYHRNYDIFLLFPGLLYIYLYAVNNAKTTTRRKWLGFLVVIILILSLFNDLVIRLSYMAALLQNNYFWRIIAPLPSWATIAVFIALLWLKTRSLTPHKNKAFNYSQVSDDACG